MTYSITQVAKLANVSTRTLRYYDEIDLLKPLTTSRKEVRQYDKNHLLTLQTILLYREMGLPLKEIKRIIHASSFQQTHALQFHQMHLHSELAKIKQMIATVEKTIKHLVDDMPLDEIELFSGLQHPEQTEIKQALQKKLGALGDTIINTAKHSASTSTPKKIGDNLNQIKQVLTDFLTLIEENQPASSSAAQQWVGRYVSRVKQHMPDLSNEDIMRMITLETTDAKFKQRMDHLHPQLADYFLQAASLYLQQK